MLSHSKAFFTELFEKKKKKKNKLKLGLLETHLLMHISGQTSGRRLKAFFADHQKTTNSLNCFYYSTYDIS